MKLFERDNRNVKLTPAGRLFVEDAAKVLTLSERVAERAKALENAKKKTVSIAYSPRVSLRLLSIICGLLLSRKPEINVKLVSAHTHDQIQALLEGSIQVGLLTLPVKNESLVVKPLLREPLVIVVSESHRLSAKAELNANELNGIPLITVSRQAAPAFHDHVNLIFKRFGYKPTVVQEVTAEAEALVMAAEGIGVALVRASAIPPGRRGIACCRFREPALVQETGIAYRRSTRSNQIQTFISVLEKSVEQITDDFRDLRDWPADADPRQLRLF